MDDVRQPLGEEVLGCQARPAHVVDRDRRNTIEALFARQHENGRKAPAGLNGDVDRGILPAQDDDPVNVEGGKVAPELAVRPGGVGQGDVIPGLG